MPDFNWPAGPLWHAVRLLQRLQEEVCSTENPSEQYAAAACRGVEGLRSKAPKATAAEQAMARVQFLPKWGSKQRLVAPAMNVSPARLDSSQLPCPTPWLLSS